MQVRHLSILLLAAIVAGTGFITDASAEPQDSRRTQAQETGRQMRFQAMDTDNDGVITRAEWRGNLQSFRRHDRNGDGVLSGDEVRVLQESPETGQELTSVFERADRNNDRVLSRSEWYGDRNTFDRVDRNNDGRITLAEFLGDDVAGTTGTTGSRRQAFAELDSNGNGVITQNEWPMDRETFEALDEDDDGVITRAEYADRENRSEAWRAGYARGMADGRQAGYEDKNVNGGRWDLDGQRELEQADAGYAPVVGSRQDYQAGYRAGFRRGYGVGFGRR